MTFDRIDLRQLSQELTRLRRDLHRFPEPGWTEFRTTARIVAELEALGLPVRRGREIHVPEKMLGLPDAGTLERCWQEASGACDRPELLEEMRGGFTGCVTAIQGALPGPTVGIRVDIDCNDVEETDDPRHAPCAQGFRSCRSACMHACGHDAHAAIGVGAARLLAAYRDRLRGKVVLAFQPGEEGLRGAASMVAAGVFDGCDYFFGAHIGLLPGLHVGSVAVSAHGFLSSTKLDISFRGIPAHAGGAPETGRNAVAAAAAATLGMLSISRHHAGPTRINVGTFHGGTGRNVIPAEAVLAVETRGGTPELNEYMEAEARRICRGAADMYGCTCEARVMGGAAGAVCDRALAKRAADILSRLDGVDEILPDVDFGSGEDVTTIMRAVQSRGGQATELIFGMPLKALHHNDRFDVDEDVILLGARIFASLALEIEDCKAAESGE